METKISERAAAKLMGISYQTLSNWRKKGSAPNHEVIKISAKTIVLFDEAAVKEWIRNKDNTLEVI